ncbi:hypothetical protein [Mesorhizobium sp. B4-1-4]|uniref:hypothetical protein n=1 Tax=Mesorhizobium sp. B4-1-4 TaxID=2589888 RepID=UPI00112A4386|nr:hypothetical protein [Mesorhizobium sp. B4-1-4]UCI29437.1 hypothetical protein FJW03_16395 [Mesorhizobium sp. B4-1-4]
METGTRTDRLAANLKQLADRAANLQMAWFFPHPDSTPGEQQMSVVEHGQELVRLAAAAEAVGKPDVAKQARQYAEQMSNLKERWQSRIAKG